MPTDLLRHLHAFHAVAERGGVRQAGGTLLRAPSTVTRAVLRLEDELALALFERGAHGMRLMPAGARVLAHARTIEAELAAVHAQAARSQARRGPIAALASLFRERRLALAVQLTELGRMSQVAQASAVSQPAVSQAITGLEADLGQPIFTRGAERMEATETGRLWTGHFARALDALGRVRAEAGEDGDGDAFIVTHPGV
jgi:DNA-binding transcriptional LysR family regulator